MQNCISGDVNLGEHIISESLKFCAAIDKEKSSEINRFQRALVRVARLERAASTSQMWRPTNWATPGYFAACVLYIIPRINASYLCVWPIIVHFFRKKSR